MTREELEDQKQENEAMKMAKEKAKREAKKQSYKVIWNIAKAAIVPMVMLLVKILAVILIISMISALFTVVINAEEDEEDETSVEEEYESISSESNGGIDLTADYFKLEEATIESVINYYENKNGKKEITNKLRENKYAILKWQEENCTALVYLVVANYEYNESSDTYEDFWNDWKNIVIDCRTIQDIANVYKEESEATEWANTIETEMRQVSRYCGILLPGQYSVDNKSESGYNTIFVSKTGKTYKNYKQNSSTIPGYYYNLEWFDDKDEEDGENTIRKNGCTLVSTAIIISGYYTEGQPPDPYELAIEDNNKHVTKSGMYFGKAFKTYNIQYNIVNGTEVIESSDNKFLTTKQKETLKSNLAESNPVIIRVQKPNEFTGGTHYMALLEYNADTNEIYVSNPSGSKDGVNTGWLPAEDVLYMSTMYYKIK